MFTLSPHGVAELISENICNVRCTPKGADPSLPCRQSLPRTHVTQGYGFIPLFASCAPSASWEWDGKLFG